MASRFQGVHKESTGYKMLAALGWREGEGLGAMKQGITEHIRVKKIHEKTGVGAAEAAVKARDWTLGMVAYDRVLAALTEVTSHHAARSTDSGSDGEERVVSPTEVAAAKAAAKAVRLARKAAKAAKVTAESRATGELVEAEGGAVSSKKKRKQPAPPAQDTKAAQTQPAAAEAAAVPAEPEVKRVRRATHVGRFKRREAGKRVRGYSSDDLTAILGGQPQAAAAVADESASIQAVAERVAERAASPETPSASEPPKPTSSDLPQPEGGSPEADAVSSEQQPDTAERRWWHGYFVRAGRLGGLRKVKKDTARGEGNGFLEDDQVAVWTAAQDGATKSKQGLGRSGQPRKVAGARWQGTRTKLGSDDDASDGASDVDDDAAPSEDGADEEQVVIRAPKRAAALEPALPAAAAEAAAAASAPAVCESSAAVETVIKWKKISRKVLEAQPGRAMKLKKLQSLAVTAAKLPAGFDSADAASSLESVLRRSSMFAFEGKVVSLAKR